ncbi:MAG: hypothetical protein IID50_02240 [Proteobacteria bacterium]|nr:hypothetical protein [Pseudomonadota bacterium]MCH8038510.1 hypothetical protein [Pseudomonadota bacterium]
MPGRRVRRFFQQHPASRSRYVRELYRYAREVVKDVKARRREPEATR